jgi:hypothetical protein
MRLYASLDDCVVKFNDADLLHKGDARVFVRAMALKSSPNEPRNPEVYGWFSWHSPLALRSLPSGGFRNWSDR